MGRVGHPLYTTSGSWGKLFQFIGIGQLFTMLGNGLPINIPCFSTTRPLGGNT